MLHGTVAYCTTFVNKCVHIVCGCMGWLGMTIMCVVVSFSVRYLAYIGPADAGL